MTDAASSDPATALIQPTPCALRCLELARIIAAREDLVVGVDLLLTCVVLGSGESSRARIAVTNVGAILRFPKESRALLDDAAGFLGRSGPRGPFAPEVTAALKRVPYWVERTGDEDADSVHLLLALLEAYESGAASSNVISVLGVNVRDFVRMAMTTRESVAADDRQRGGCRPILSAARANRPMPYQFLDRPPEAPLLKRRNYKWRSWTASGEHLNSFVLRGLLQRQTVLITVLSTLHLAVWVAVVYATVRIDHRAALGLLALWATVKSHPWPLRLAVDAALFATFTAWGLPLWIPALGVVYHALETLESRIAVLVVRDDTGDPALTVKDLRSDLRTNAATANLRRVVK